VLTVVARRWAVPGAVVATIVAVAAGDLPAGAFDHPWPVVELTAPHIDAGALISLGLPLFVVTMASQNVPGMAVLATYGYRPPLRPLLVSTGAATAIGAPFGAHAINLAAITAALVAGPEAGPDRSRRWIAAVSSGAAYGLLALVSGAATVLVAAAPPVLIEAAAGLALLGALGAALTAALADEERREAATITFVVAASGVTLASISAPFWGLVAGLIWLVLRRAPARRPAAQPSGAPESAAPTAPR
jgi:benzoate membrane transport protein